MRKDSKTPLLQAAQGPTQQYVMAGPSPWTAGPGTSVGGSKQAGQRIRQRRRGQQGRAAGDHF